MRAGLFFVTKVWIQWCRILVRMVMPWIVWLERVGVRSLLSEISCIAVGIKSDFYRMNAISLSRAVVDVCRN